MADTNFAFTPGAVIPLLKETAEGFQEHLLDIRSVLLEAMETTKVAHDALLTAMADGGTVELANAPLPNGLKYGQVTDWSSSLEFLYQNALVAGEATAEALLEASKGDRNVIYTPMSPNWELAALPTDPFKVVVSPDGVPMMVTPTGSMYMPPAAAASTLGEPITIGVVVMVVAGLLTYAFIAYFGVQAIIAGFQTLRQAITSALEAYNMRNMYKCMETQSPKDCQESAIAAAKAHEIIADADTRRILADNEALKNQNNALWAFAAIGVVGVLGYGAYKYNKA